MPCAALPPDASEWQKRAQWLVRDFVTTSKNTREALQDMILFANGDSSLPTVVHWCVSMPGRNCCDSDEESMCKFLSHAVPFFSKGYQTPLLYRMKGYGPASSWVKFGCGFFNLLPRVLQVMGSAEPSSELASLADAFLAESRFQAVGGEDADFQQILADALDGDQNYAAQNKLRRQLVAQEMSRPSFLQASIAIDAIIAPIEYGVNYLLGHTKLLHDLNFLGRGHPKCDALKEESHKKFMHVVSGGLANSLIRRFILFLEHGLKEAFEMGLVTSNDLLNKVFQLTTLCITDLHRRLKHELSSHPFQMPLA